VLVSKERCLGGAILACAAIGFSSCAAIGARQGKNRPKPYAGVKQNAHFVAHPDQADQPVLQPLNLVDMPFSFVVDTFMLPWGAGQGIEARTSFSC
jgi:uncharacterized protein YceK